MSLWKNYFGLGEVASSGATPTDGSTPTQALPASWYTSQELYELERRAVFSRKWLLTTHIMRLPNTGDWLQYKIADYPFVLVKDREGKINAFHNVCRHRAFPVVTEESGKSRIFSCKYHGWSYGLNGKLAKAPGYQELEGFDKSQNGLLPIHIHVDSNGFIWVNLDGQKPEIAWEDDFKEIDLQPRFKDLDFTNFQFDHTWEMEGEYNWKLLADNYHCQASHPDTPDFANLESYAVAEPEQIERSLKTANTYYFPNASMTVSPHFFFMQRFVPTSPTTCSMRYEVYRHKASSDEDFELICQTYKRIMAENKDHCIQAQKNLDDPRVEKGPLHFQTAVRDILQEHHKREEEEQQEIWPARQTLPEQASTSKEDQDFCTKLEGQRAEIPDCSTMAGQGGCCSGGMGCQSANDALVY